MDKHYMKDVFGGSLLNAFILLGGCVDAIHFTPYATNDLTNPLVMHYLDRFSLFLCYFFMAAFGLPCNLKLTGCSLLFRASYWFVRRLVLVCQTLLAFVVSY